MPTVDTGTIIVEAYEGEPLAEARSLMEEYAASLEFGLGFQDFDREMDSLPGEYAPPSGRLFLALLEDRAAGCVAMRRIDAERAELKRLYVRPVHRGKGLGRILARAVVDAAMKEGYSTIMLDTVASMETARTLYASLGFRETEPYRFNPLPGAVYMELDLEAAGSDEGEERQ